MNDNPYTNQLQSFKKYGEWIRAKELAEKMYKDNLMKELIEARQQLAGQKIQSELPDQLSQLQDTLKPVSNILAKIEADTTYIRKVYSTPAPTKKSSKKMTRAERINALADAEIKRANKKGVKI